ncbi:MAG: penicillin-binding protein 2 [Flavobacteriales bacterium]|nr:penicillin-binding protein 2 [Flavobacteriales bacterium]|tara:strand:+ start:8458 stop:10251 length:1794 start_codon:yes stop_codon:yes gene_type:complete
MKRYDLYAHRKYPIIIIIIICIFLIIVKLFIIQIIDKSYKLSAENNTIRKIIQYPERGWIYDRNNTLLVSNQRGHDIMISPYQVESQIDTSFFCEIFQISKSDFLRRIKQAKQYSYYKPSIFIKNIEKNKFADIQEYLYRFKGFFSQPRYIREYNTNSGGNIFGYTSLISYEELLNNKAYDRNDMIGVTGIEKVFETKLKGEKGVQRKIVDVFGKYQGDFQNGKYDTLPKKGQDIKITIDIILQEYAEKLMSNKRGSIVAIEPESGEILCLLSSPSYSPKMFIGKNRSKNFRDLFIHPGKPLYDRSTSALYPPGSIFKLLNALIGLQEKKINPEQLIKCNLGWNYKSRLNIGCHEHKSPLNLNQAIAQSCNAYFCETFIKIIQDSPSKNLDKWKNYIESFGLNQTFQNDLYNEKKGFIPNAKYYDNLYGKKRWGAPTCVSLAIGQDAILMTPIQMANLTATIANKGFYRIPHIVKQDSLVEKMKCLIDSNYFEPVIYGMVNAIEDQYGTAKLGVINDLEIGGKTGTAQNPHGSDHSVFIAFAPISKPKIAIAVFVENGGWGSEMAVPIGSLCIEKYLLKNIQRKKLEDRMIKTKINY